MSIADIHQIIPSVIFDRIIYNDFICAKKKTRIIKITIQFFTKDKDENERIFLITNTKCILYFLESRYSKDRITSTNKIFYNTQLLNLIHSTCPKRITLCVNPIQDEYIRKYYEHYVKINSKNVDNVLIQFRNKLCKYTFSIKLTYKLN